MLSRGHAVTVCYLRLPESESLEIRIHIHAIKLVKLQGGRIVAHRCMVRRARRKHVVSDVFLFSHEVDRDVLAQSSSRFTLPFHAAWRRSGSGQSRCAGQSCACGLVATTLRCQSCRGNFLARRNMTMPIRIGTTLTNHKQSVAGKNFSPLTRQPRRDQNARVEFPPPRKRYASCSVVTRKAALKAQRQFRSKCLPESEVPP